MRGKFRAHKTLIDCAAGSGKTVYRMLKGHQAKPLQQFPTATQVNASLCRSTKASILLKIDNCVTFILDQAATFGDAEVMNAHQHGALVKVTLVKRTIPIKGFLMQSSSAYSTSDMFRQFHCFWAPIWLREHQHEQFDTSAWEDFFQQLEDVLLPAFDIKVTLEELKVWLKQAIIDLCSVFKKILPKGMPPDLAQARVVMLEKTSRPRGIQDGRPMTFFSVLQINSTLLPPQISGGLVARGTYDLPVPQHFQRQEGVSTQSHTLDLVKAFTVTISPKVSTS